MEWKSTLYRCKWGLGLCLLLAAVPLSAQERAPASGWEEKTKGEFDDPAAFEAPGDLSQTADRLRRFLHGSAAAKAAGVLAGWELARNESNGTPIFLSAPPLARPAAKPAKPLAPARGLALALDFLDAHRALFRLERPRDELAPRATATDPGGNVHVSLQQHYRGIPLLGCDLVVHLSPDGTPYAMNGRYVPTPSSAPSLEPAVDAGQAIGVALAHLGLEAAPGRPQADQYVWIDPATQRPHLAWQVEVQPTLRHRWLYCIDAHSGQILDVYDATATQGPTTAVAPDLSDRLQTLNVYQAADAYCMLDAARPGLDALQVDLGERSLAVILDDPLGALITLDARQRDLSFIERVAHIVSPDNTWTDPVAVSAHYHAGQVFDYYFATHDRLGLDGRGGTIFSIIHVTDGGRAMDNAYYNGGVVAYGDGSTRFGPLAGALDVVAHEMTHAVIAQTVDLEYRFEAGALSESLCDVFAVMIDRDDWRIGEDVVRRDTFPSGALRDLADPHNGFEPGHPSWQPAHMDEFVELDLGQDNGGVHINSGIPNRAAFLIGEAIGREKTERIYYRVLEARYLNRRANFVDMRLAAVRAAGDLFGGSSAEAAAVIAAFDEVGIEGTIGALPAPDLAPVFEEEWIAAADPRSFTLQRIRPVIRDERDIVRLTDTKLTLNTGSPISISADGSVLLFLDEDRFIRAIRSDGSDETVISGTNGWSSLALSPDGTRLAATTVARDSTIFLFDLEDPEASKRVRLYNPTTQEGVRDFTVRFADAMDWSGDSRFLLFDCLNSIPREGSRSIEFWRINLLEPDGELILPFLPDQFATHIDIGNPSFAQTSDDALVFETFNTETSEVEIWATDLFSGARHLIEANGAFSGYPRYAPNDDYLVFERRVNGFPTLRKIRLQDDKIRAAAPSEYLIEAMRPAWFGTPAQPSAVGGAGGERPRDYRLAPNYPNPFNAATTIAYELPGAADVSLAVYDLAGQRVKVLVAGPQTAGSHAVGWSGRNQRGDAVASGVYFYRLEATGRAGERFVQSRKMALLR